MKTLYFVDLNGAYLGGFSEGNPAIPKDAIEVDLPPNNAKDIFKSGEWLVTQPSYKELREAEFNLKSTGEQFGMMYDDAVNGSNTWVEWQTSIKLRITK